MVPFGNDEIPQSTERVSSWVVLSSSSLQLPNGFWKPQKAKTTPLETHFFTWRRSFGLLSCFFNWEIAGDRGGSIPNFLIEKTMEKLSTQKSCESICLWGLSIHVVVFGEKRFSSLEESLGPQFVSVMSPTEKVCLSKPDVSLFQQVSGA